MTRTELTPSTHRFDWYAYLRAHGVPTVSSMHLTGPAVLKDRPRQF